MNLDRKTIRLVRTGFVAHCAFTDRIRVHSHDREYEFHFFSGGEGRFINGRDVFRVAAPSLVFTPPDVGHGIQTLRSGSKLCFFYLCFEVEPGGADILQALYGSFRRIGSLRTGMDFASRMERLVVNHQSPDELLNVAAQHEFVSILYEIIARVRAPEAIDANIYVRKLISGMRGAVNGGFDLGSAAAELGISKAHLVRVFKRGTGLPPVRYFNRLKMDTARELLKRTDMPLARIAAELSFCDEFYFSRVFKKYAGMSPDHYRKSLGRERRRDPGQ